jgi:hypothetical protein
LAYLRPRSPQGAKHVRAAILDALAQLSLFPRVLDGSAEADGGGSPRDPREGRRQSSRVRRAYRGSVGACLEMGVRRQAAQSDGAQAACARQ